MAFRNRIVRISQLIADSLTGALIRTAASGQRWEMSSGFGNELRGYSGEPNETQPGLIEIDSTTNPTNGGAWLALTAPTVIKAGIGRVQVAQVWMESDYNTQTGVAASYAIIRGDQLYFTGPASSSRLTPQFFTGNEGAVLGAAPPAGTPKLIKQSSVVCTVSASGTIDFDFHDGAFPNGLVSLVCMPGDNTGAFSGVRPILGFCSTGHVGAFALKETGGSVATGVQVRVNYIAYGW